MKKSGLVLAVAAGSALSATALAQVNDLKVPPAFPITIDQIHGGGFARGHYGSRVDTNVYGIGWQDQTGGGAAGPATAATVYDDVTFGGACSTTLPITINGLAIGFWEPATATPADDHIYVKVSFYPDHNNAAAATLPPYSGTPVVWNLDFGTGFSGCPGCGEFFHDSITFNGSTTLDATNVFNSGAADRTCGVLEELFSDAALTVRRDGYGIMRRATFTSWLVGTSDYFGWYDQSNPNTGTIQNNATYVSGGTLATARGTFLDLQATGCSIPPPTATAIGCLTDTQAPVTGTLADGGVNWYTFCLPAGATDDVLKYLDIDTEGSADVAIGVYDSTGLLGLNSSDFDGGSGTNSQLSFGIGRRAAVADGLQYDGRNFIGGAAGIAAGTYYLAVASNGSAFGPTAWGVNPAGTGGAYTLHFRTNVNGGALNPSVAPVPLAGDDFSATPLVAPGAQIVTAALAPYTVRWIKFATCTPSDNTNTVVINMNGSDAVRSALTLFDHAGNLVAQTENTAGLSTLTFDASTVLPADTYYLAMTYAGRQLSPDPTTNGRWHLRSTAGDNGFDFAGEIDVVNGSCAAPGGCTADFNCDGDVGTDADIESFFACLAGTCPPPPCANTADFNNDGDVGTDADIESFFRVLAGGPC